MARVLGAVGGMTLSLYALQIGWLAFDGRVLHPGMRDGGWSNLAVLVAGSLIVATLWRFGVRHEPWRRGPLEGPLVALSTRSRRT